ncbi:hypothetical protein GGU11DRAFT_801995 [Lentinula aff. detonsa]|nr:hypothetical protein GGU11DRAFT_801995 [Lentinula aff. detonsa]
MELSCSGTLTVTIMFSLTRAAPKPNLPSLLFLFESRNEVGIRRCNHTLFSYLCALSRMYQGTIVVQHNTETLQIV